MISILLCCICIGLSKEGVEVDPELQDKLLPMWIPLLFGIAAPAFMTINTLMVKHMTKESTGFKTSRVTFNALIAFNVLLLCYAIPFWVENHSFTWKSFMWGLIGGITGGIGFGLL